MRPEYLQVRPGGPIPNVGPQPCRVLLVADLAVEAGWRNDLSDHLVATGCLYFCAWGVDCSIWHDYVDEAHLAMFDYEDVPDEKFVMTTWHEGEPLEEAMWFAHHCASHPDVELKRFYILHIAGNPDKKRVLARYDKAVNAPLDRHGNAPWED